MQSTHTHSEAVTSVQFDPQHSRIFSVSEDSTLRIFDFVSKKTHTVKAHKDPITAVHIAPNGKLIGMYGDGDRGGDGDGDGDGDEDRDWGWRWRW